jgi:hypothetical protein
MNSIAYTLASNYKLLLSNYDNIASAAHYRNCQLDLLFRDKDFNNIEITLVNLLDIWINVATYINNKKVYLISMRKKESEIHGTGITEEGEIEIGIIVFDTGDANSILPYVEKDENINLYVPLFSIIIELTLEKKEYLNWIQKVNDNFDNVLQSTNPDAPAFVKLKQKQDKFEITISSKYSMHKFCDGHRDGIGLRVNALFIESIRYSMGKLGYILDTSSTKLEVTKTFNHPKFLLRKDTFDDINIALTEIENIVHDYERLKLPSHKNDYSQF